MRVSFLEALQYGVSRAWIVVAIFGPLAAASIYERRWPFSLLVSALVLTLFCDKEYFAAWRGEEPDETGNPSCPEDDVAEGTQQGLEQEDDEDEVDDWLGEGEDLEDLEPGSEGARRRKAGLPESFGGDGTALSNESLLDHFQWQDDSNRSLDACGCTADESVLNNARSDQVSKARLDLLFRYMENQTRDQGTTLTPQRQKLLRKLQQRTAATFTKAITAGDGEEASCNGEAVATAAASEDILQDSGKMEELLRELGEVGVVSASKVADPKAKRAKRKGGNCRTAAPRRVRQEPQQEPSKQPSPAAAPVKEAVDDSQAQAISAMAEGEDDEEEVDEEEEETEAEAGGTTKQAKRKKERRADALEGDASGFQVVETRKAKRKGRRSAIAEQVSEAGADVVCACDVPPREEEEAKAGNDTKVASGTGAAAGSSEKVSGAAMPKAEANDRASTAGSPDAAAPAGPRAEKEAAAGAEASTSAPLPAADEDDGEEEAWEWQCPAGTLLEPYVCDRPAACSSCQTPQAAGAKVLRSETTHWIACEECIRIAYEQPVEQVEHYPSADAVDDGQIASPTNAGSSPAPSGTGGNGVEAATATQSKDTCLDPSRMSALEVVEWFRKHGAEDALRQCMMEVAINADRTTSSNAADGTKDSS
eukprot:gnl/TRDRNA2_/TRDRNA2_28174_c0_seq1.p1 gnl/TRDRNA2_/TRDRNA2_28174_c0~~gnl/TRDRNA2_/TRDRNA2_28174_c0_seq1.p1  ORF type:complete len:650 (-),score=170.22 gnl/TRDRNA2_/TRDRNA2_28174_c0_seq1:46-1995(-)